ncbi:MAG: hypothetical protein K0Q79_2455 [Flavipsychrobacter sp.]|jgi:hypothetical protein|nr:hypothetical protein [Flavipsychrobacter sp.]
MCDLKTPRGSGAFLLCYAYMNILTLQPFNLLTNGLPLHRFSKYYRCQE